MATVRELQTKARKLYLKWKKDYAKGLEKDQRSPVSHLCLTILLRNNTVTNAAKAEQALRTRFVDWNEIRVSPVAEVRDALEEAGTPNAEQKAYALRRFLRDVFGKFTKTNLYFDLMEIPEVVPELLPGEKAPETDDDDEDAEEAVTRESGLPPHPEVPGYVDMVRILDQPMPLDPKLIMEKNAITVCSVAWDDAERGPFSIIWRVALAEGLIEPEYEGTEALSRLRNQIAPEKERDEFAFYAILHAENNWPKISKAADKVRKKVAKAKA
ncbi:MAG: hypothetical protein KDB90_15430 [Planctomycetes bacterium]|nr:hypothetical protein [Planctomycetota bacterium]